MEAAVRGFCSAPRGLTVPVINPAIQRNSRSASADPLRPWRPRLAARIRKFWDDGDTADTGIAGRHTLAKLDQSPSPNKKLASAQELKSVSPVDYTFNAALLVVGTEVDLG